MNTQTVMDVLKVKMFAVFAALSLLFSTNCCDGKMVSIKIVEEPSSYGVNAADNTNSEPTIKMRVPPANFSGPPHLKLLKGKCYSKIDDDYRYELCPFSNVTQHEQSLRWNPYSGVLGVWQDWEIENNTFVAMMMEEGDTCGEIYRSVKVILACGNKTSIGKVSEPRTCHYEMILLTPLVCHPHARLVYPTLPENLRDEWDLLEGRLLNEEVTQQGYKKMLRKIFEKAGYILPDTQKTKISEAAKKREVAETKKETGDFESLYECKTEYQSLKTEIEGLRTLLEVHGIDPDSKNKKKDRGGTFDDEYPERKYPNLNNIDEYPENINDILPGGDYQQDQFNDYD